MLESMDRELASIRENIREAQKRHKKYYDKKHRDLEFKLGDMVFLKVVPERSNLSLGVDKRLSPRFAGPFKVLRRVGKLAYKLELPSNIKVPSCFSCKFVEKICA